MEARVCIVDISHSLNAVIVFTSIDQGFDIVVVLLDVATNVPI